MELQPKQMEVRFGSQSEGQQLCIIKIIIAKKTLNFHKSMIIILGLQLH